MIRTIGKRKTSASKDEAVSQHNFPTKMSSTNIPEKSSPNVIPQKQLEKIESEKSKQPMAAAAASDAVKIRQIIQQKQPEKIESEKSKQPAAASVADTKNDESLDFETSTTLESLTKSRAKLPTNRRAPTKKGLKAIAESGMDQVDSSLVGPPTNPVNPLSKPVDPLTKPVDKQAKQVDPIAKSVELKSENIQTEMRKAPNEPDAKTAITEKVKQPEQSTEAKMEEKVTDGNNSTDAKTKEKVKEPEISLTKEDKTKAGIEKKSLETKLKTETEKKKRDENEPKAETVNPIAQGVTVFTNFLKNILKFYPIFMVFDFLIILWILFV